MTNIFSQNGCWKAKVMGLISSQTCQQIKLTVPLSYSILTLGQSVPALQLAPGRTAIRVFLLKSLIRLTLGKWGFITMSAAFEVGASTTRPQAVCWLLIVPATCECISGLICSVNFTCCHTEIELADPTFYLTQSQCTGTGPTSPSTHPITPGTWQVSHWRANF